MSKLSLKTVRRKNLPYGKFSFVVCFKRDSHQVWHCPTNAGEIEPMRNLLRDGAIGSYKFLFETNRREKRVYTHLYLTNAMDLALIKLVFSDKLHKIYKIEATGKDQPYESPLKTDQTGS